MEYTVLASTSHEADEAVDDHDTDDWHLLHANKDCEDGADVTTKKPQDELHKQESQDEPSSSTSAHETAEEMSALKSDDAVVEAIDDITSETKAPDNNDQSKASEPTEGWNAYFRKGAVAAVGGTMVGVGLVMIPLPTPFGAVVASSGLAVLGTEFEGAKDLNDTLIASTQEKLENVRFRVEESLSKSNTPKFLSKTLLPFVKRKPSQAETPNLKPAEEIVTEEASTETPVTVDPEPEIQRVADESPSVTEEVVPSVPEEVVPSVTDEAASSVTDETASPIGSD